MTSVHSQPINTISYTEHQYIKNQTFKPKYLELLDQQKNYHTIDQPPNKLPFNLFLSATQYNKMIITNGKSRKKRTPQTIDGLITSLQYMNDPIFQKQISKRQRAKQTIKIQSKPQKKQGIKNCKCSCCHDFCQQCTKTGQKCNKFYHIDPKKAKSFQDETQIRKKYQINYKPKNQKSKFIDQSRRANSSFDKSRKNKSSINDQSMINKSRTKKNVDISHLLIKSLIQFTQKKKAEQVYKASIQRTKHAKQEYLKLLNEKIRCYNLQGSRRSGQKSRSKTKSLTKQQLSLKYWQNIKDEVLQSLKNDNYSHPLKSQLQNYQLNVYDHKQIPIRKPRLSKQQIQYLRQVRGSQAKKTIQYKSRQKKQVQKRIKSNLKSLDKQRKKRISHNPKKTFQPSANMIRSAFQNIVQSYDNKKGQKQMMKNQKQQRNGSSIFMNQGIRGGKIINKKQSVNKK